MGMLVVDVSVRPPRWTEPTKVAVGHKRQQLDTTVPCISAPSIPFPSTAARGSRFPGRALGRCRSMSSINAALITSTADVEAGSKQNHEVPITLTWRGVSAFVQKGAKKDGLEQILFDACGEARPGEILAVMGPSGAGKTTLLNLLADRPALGDNGKSEGTFCINGLPLPQGWKRSIGYSMQKDIFFVRVSGARSRPAIQLSDH